jgi:hypothetical protein
MKALMFLNPKRRRRKTRRVTARRARRMNRNPIRRRRRRTRRAVAVAPIRRRRRTIRAVRRRSYRRRSTRSFSRRIRRYAGRNGGNLSFKSIMQREYLTMAAGAVAAGVAVPWIVSTFTDKTTGKSSLPGLADLNSSDAAKAKHAKYFLIGYAVALPILGAMVVQKFNRDFAKGLLLAGVVQGANALLEAATTPTSPVAVKAPSAYLDYMPRRQIAGAAGPGYSAVNSFNAPLLSNASAFSDDPWAVSR